MARGLAASLGGRAVGLAELAAEIAAADLVVSSTGATGLVVEVSAVGNRAAHPLVVLDVALPRDVDPAVATLPGVTYVDLDSLRADGAMVSDSEVALAGAVLAEELAKYLAQQQALAVAPTVTALRARAGQVVDVELARLDARMPGLDPAVRNEVADAVRRAVEKVLHAPTVRVKELAATPGRRPVRGGAARAVRPRPGPARVRNRRAPSWRGTMTATTRSSRVLRVGTRGSLLARTQTDLVVASIGVPVEIVHIVTAGDRSSAAMDQIGGTGVFVSALRSALLAGEIDIAVHSYKDLPTAAAEGIVVAAVPQREDPRDALVARDGLTLGQLPAGSRVGTGSPRRAAQLKALGFGLSIEPLRGNVDTRLGRVAKGDLDAVVLALAGLRRLGRDAEVSEILDPIQMLPAPAQGALAIECRESDADVRALLSTVDSPDARAAIAAERALLAALEAGCTAPVAALAEIAEGDDGPEVFLRGSVTAPDGLRAVRLSATGPVTDAEGVGRRLAAELISEGADEMMGSSQ